MNVKNEDFFEFFPQKCLVDSNKVLTFATSKITLTTKTMKKFIENPIQWWKSLEEDHKWLVVIAAMWVVCFLPHSFIFALLGPIVARVLW